MDQSVSLPFKSYTVNNLKVYNWISKAEASNIIKDSYIFLIDNFWIVW